MRAVLLSMRLSCVSAGGSASVGGAPGHACVIIPQAHLGLFSLATAAFATFQGEGKSMLGLMSPGLTEPGHHHLPHSIGQSRSQGQFSFRNWKNRPYLLMGVAARSQYKGLHAGRAGEGSPPSTADPSARTATSRVRAVP